MNSLRSLMVSAGVNAPALGLSFIPISQPSGGTVRRSLFFLAGLSVFSFFAPRVEAASRWETLEAIHWVENPHDRREPGPFGELGAYQFRQETWKMHSARPFREALDRSRSDEVAVKHYELIKAALERNGIEPSTYNIALAWNAGISSTVNGKVPASSRDYAMRVTNIAGQLGSAVATTQ